MRAPSINIINAKSPADVQAVKEIFLEYISFIEDFLEQSLCFQGTDEEFATFPKAYETLWLAKLGSTPVAACGVKIFKPGICELKRLYCRPDGRGHGLGLKLTETAINFARQSGYSQMYLDTDPGLKQANVIYENLGFKDIERYYENPMGCSRYMALAL